MRFKLTDWIDFYRLPSNVYSLELFVTQLTPKEYFGFVEKLRYYTKKDGVSYLSVFSTTSSESAKVVITHTQKRGRPRKEIVGEKVAGHSHTIIMGTPEKSAYSTAKIIKKSVDKKYQKRVMKIVSLGRDTDHTYNMIGYCFRQAEIVRSGGNFDFKAYYDERSI